MIVEEETDHQTDNDEISEQEAEESRDTFSEPSNNIASPSIYPSNTGRPGIGTIPRTIPLYLNSGRHRPSHSVGVMQSRSDSPSASSASRISKEAEDAEGGRAEREDNFSPQSFPRSGIPAGTPLGRNYSTGPGSFSGTFSGITPLKQTATGTRYGVALSGGVGVHMTGTEASPRKWGGGTPICPRCTKSVFFAEQVSFNSHVFFLSLIPTTLASRSRQSGRRSIRPVSAAWSAIPPWTRTNYAIMMETPSVCDVTIRCVSFFPVLLLPCSCYILISIAALWPSRRWICFAR